MTTPSSAVEGIISFDSFLIPDTDPVTITPPVTEPVTPDTPPASGVPEPPAATEPQRTPWSNLLMEYRDVKKTVPADLAIPDDLTLEAFDELLFKAVEEKVLEKVKPDVEKLSAQEYNKLIEKGYTAEQIENALFISENLAQGMDSTAMQRYSYLDSLAKYEPVNEEEELEMVRRFNELRGQDPDIVETHITTKLAGEANEAVRKATVEAAKKSIAQLRDYELQQERLAAEEAKNRAADSRKKEQDAVSQAIDNGFFGIQLPPEEKTKLKKAMFEVDSYRDVQGPNGIQRIPETAESKAWRQIMSDPVKKAAFAYIAINGIEKLINTAAVKNSSNFIKAIEQQTSSVPGILDTPPPPAASSSKKGFILPV